MPFPPGTHAGPASHPTEEVMHLVLWIAAAVFVVVGVVALIVSARRDRVVDLGSVSGSWIAHHRGNYGS